MGYRVYGFTFVFPKVKTSISNITNPKNDQINVENRLEEFPSKKNIEDKMAEYNAVP